MVQITSTMAKSFNDERLKEMTRLVGAFVSAVRKTGKAPSIQTMYKEVLGRRCAATFARRFGAVMEQTVAHINGKSARLYRENRTSDELMPMVIESWFNTKVPEPTIKRPRKIMAVEIRHNDTTGDFEAPKLPEYAKLPVSPNQLTDAELDTAIQELQATLNAFVSEKNRRAEEELKKNDLLKALRELAESEGYSLEELMKMV